MSKYGKEQHSTCCLGTSQAERREQHSPKGCSMATVPSTPNHPFCSDKGAWTGAAQHSAWGTEVLLQLRARLPHPIAAAATSEHRTTQGVTWAHCLKGLQEQGTGTRSRALPT